MWFLDFRTRDVGGPVARTPALYEGTRRRGHGLGALPPSAGGVTFVVHGYNKDREDGRSQIDGFAAAAVAQVPALIDTHFVGVLWPGDAIFGALSYPTEESDADRTARRLATTLYAARLPQPVHLVAHSLGTRVALQTMTTLARWEPGTTWVEQVVLLAAAVDADCLARRDRYAAGVRRASRVVNVASTADDVLRFAFPAGDWIAGIFTGGYTRTALGRKGPAASPRPPGLVRRLQVGHHDVGHGDYLGGDNDKRRRASALSGRAVAGNERLRY